MNKLLLLILALFFFGTSNAQKKHKHVAKSNYTHKNWDSYRHEIEFGIGASNYNGDLGGNDGDAKQYSFKDTEISQTKLGFYLGYRYNFGQYLAVRPQIFYGKVSGNDNKTKNPERSYRNLAFTSSIFEFAVLGEFHILRASRGQRYFRKGVIGAAGNRYAASIHLGAGFFYYNPKYGSVALRQLSTEGQGLENGPKPYKKFAISWPIGFNVGYQLNKDLKLGLDFTYRFTNTDYIDDVGGTYYDKETIREKKGDLAAEMSNRTDGSYPGSTVSGSPRGGSKSNDSYFLLSINITYTPFQRSHGVHKKRKRARF